VAFDDEGRITKWTHWAASRNCSVCMELQSVVEALALIFGI
jgi:hypothetical protein